MIEKIMISEKFFSAPAGSMLKRLPDTRMFQVCDICGKKKPCDWYEWEPSISGMTGMDVCPTCAREHAWREKI